MKSSELERWLRKHGSLVPESQGWERSSHRSAGSIAVSQLPIHGANKELRLRRLVEKIKKDLGLK